MAIFIENNIARVGMKEKEKWWTYANECGNTQIREGDFGRLGKRSLEML